MVEEKDPPKTSDESPEYTSQHTHEDRHIEEDHACTVGRPMDCVISKPDGDDPWPFEEPELEQHHMWYCTLPLEID